MVGKCCSSPGNPSAQQSSRSPEVHGGGHAAVLLQLCLADAVFTWSTFVSVYLTASEHTPSVAALLSEALRFKRQLARRAEYSLTLFASVIYHRDNK